MDTAAAAFDFLFPRKKDDGGNKQRVDEAIKDAAPEAKAPIAPALPPKPTPGAA